MDEKSLRHALKDLPVPKIVYFEEIDSTNERALALMASGVEEFTLLAAERQTAGRGRLGRKWVTTPGSSLAFTIILHPTPDEFRLMGFFSLLGALSLCLAVEEICNLKAEVKWPNDVLLGGRKTAGILAESSFQGEDLAGVALGIGINLLSGSVPPPAEVMFPATCVQYHCTHLPKREEFLATVIKHLIFWRPRVLDEEFIVAYRARMAFMGQRVILVPPANREIEGTLIGVDDTGKLILEFDDKEKQVFPVGDLKLRLS